MIVLVMGVSGCGKSTVGEALARAMGCRFLDADEFHPPENVAKMARGIPLGDEDRWPWLDRLAKELATILARGESAVLACSALKEIYRERLKRAGDVRVVFLKGDEATIAARIAARSHQYMPPSLLPSQLATLEEPVDAIVVDVREPVAVQVDLIRRAIGVA